MSELLPRDARLIPLPVLGAMLGAFLLLIGPGEWFGLGAIRRRRWTWITFPISTAIFTAATLRAAEHYLGTTDRRAAVTIVDVGKGGRALREHRVEMIFAAREREAVSELRHSLVVPVLVGSEGTMNPAMRATYEGQVPARASLRQTVRQWVPQFNRHFAFESTAPPMGIRWDAVTADDLLNAGATRDQVFREKTGVRSDHGVATLRRRDDRLDVQTKHRALPDFLRGICFLPEEHIRNQLGTISPSGSGGLEDLALADPSTEREIVAMVIDESGPDLRIYRRRYRKED